MISGSSMHYLGAMRSWKTNSEVKLDEEGGGNSLTHLVGGVAVRKSQAHGSIRDTNVRGDTL